MIIITTTESKVKLQAITDILNPTKIIPLSTSNAKIPSQPINSGEQCASFRIDYVKSNYPIVKETNYDFIISIENGIDTLDYMTKGGDHMHFVDVCYVVIENKIGKKYYSESYAIPIDMKYVYEARKLTPTNYECRDMGLSVTAGSIINKYYPDVPADDWMKNEQFYGVSRIYQIEDALNNCLKHIPYSSSANSMIITIGGYGEQTIEIISPFVNYNLAQYLVLKYYEKYDNERQFIMIVQLGSDKWIYDSTVCTIADVDIRDYKNISCIPSNVTDDIINAILFDSNKCIINV